MALWGSSGWRPGVLFCLSDAGFDLASSLLLDFFLRTISAVWRSIDPISFSFRLHVHSVLLHMGMIIMQAHSLIEHFRLLFYPWAVQLSFFFFILYSKSVDHFLILECLLHPLPALTSITLSKLTPLLSKTPRRFEAWGIGEEGKWGEISLREEISTSGT